MSRQTLVPTGLRAPRTLIVDLAARFSGASARALGLLSGMPPGDAALACLEGSPVGVHARQMGLDVHDVGAHKLDPRLLPRLIGVIRRRGIQVLDTQNVQSKLWGGLAARATGAAVVSTLNSWYRHEHSGRAKGRLYQRIETATVRTTDMFIAVSEEIERELLNGGIGPHKIAVIPNAVDITPERIDADRAWLTGAYGLPPDAMSCCAVGRLVPAKDHQCLIDAFQVLAPKYPRLHCVIAGDGELEAPLHAAIEQRGLQGRVHLVGPVPPDVALKIIKASDFYAMPSITEGTPIALLEAGALGKPIVASDVGGIPTILRSEETGLLFRPGDPEALVRAVSRLIDEPGLAGRLGEAARRRIQNDFSRTSQVAATLQAYRTALAHHRERSPVTRRVSRAVAERS